jgi:DMSO/TMAO reductase YedYZ heme-binding membrane subunit
MYYRFCSTVHYFFERKMGMADPDIYSMVFITLCMVVYGLGIVHIIEVIEKKRLIFPSVYYYIAAAAILLANYLIVYRRGKQNEYYQKLINPYLVVAIIIFGYVLMGVTGQINRGYFIGKR